MKNLIIFIVFFNQLITIHSQTITENDIKKIAEKVNNELIGSEISEGVTVRGCLAFGRTLVYMYNVANNWYPNSNIKDEIIANLKTGGQAVIYSKYDINVNFQYYNGNKLVKNVSIKSIEFSNHNYSLGVYISIKGHPKAKGVNLKIKQPLGWDILEGDRPNIVKKFINDINAYVILVKDNVTFMSRREAKELLDDKKNVNEFIKQSSSSLENAEILNQKIVTLDSYPTLVFTIRGDKERLGVNFKMITKIWVIFYEDKIISISGGGLDGAAFKSLELLYNNITNSVIFPDQYN